MKYDPKYYKTHTKTEKGERKCYLYRKFTDMRRRCYNSNFKNYKYYGERGIKVEEWLLNFHNYVDYIIDILPKGATIEDMQKLSWTVDRIDNDGDYKRGNLRWVSKRMQQLNRGNFKNNSSGFRGVCWHKRDKKWRAQITARFKVICLGLFNTREEAFAVYLEAVLKYHGQEAYEHVLSLHPHWEAA